MAVFRGQQAVMARGALGPAASADGSQACLQALSKVLWQRCTICPDLSHRVLLGA